MAVLLDSQKPGTQNPNPNFDIQYRNLLADRSHAACTMSKDTSHMVAPLCEVIFRESELVG